MIVHKNKLYLIDIESIEPTTNQEYKNQDWTFLLKTVPTKLQNKIKKCLQKEKIR